jgi:hypothetical protein
MPHINPSERVEVVNLADFKQAKLDKEQENKTEEDPLYDIMDGVLDFIEEQECEAIVILVRDGNLLTATTHQDTEELLEMLCTAKAEIKGQLK